MGFQIMGFAHLIGFKIWDSPAHKAFQYERDIMADGCAKCDVVAPHFHIDNSGPICHDWEPGTKHPAWCSAKHEIIRWVK
jgi:hypothetical protein